MSQYYDLNNTGPQVQDRLDQTQENKQDIATLEGKVTAIENEIGESGQGGNTINARLDALETAVGSGGSVDERIAAAETEIIGGASSDYNTLGKVEGELEDTYRKNETYSKTELDNLITTPNVLYVTVIATNGTTDVTTLLPATGAADTVYRVGNWDGTQYDTTMYALYAWNGTAYVCLAVRSFVGEVYDISVNHPDGQGNPTPYSDLAAALGTNGANIPADIRRGGMSIKFIQGTVQSSDNKYVQARLMSDAFNTTPANWQGVDDAPTAGSNNFVKSGGVYNDVDKLEIKRLDETSVTSNWTKVYSSLPAGTTIYYRIYSLIPGVTNIAFSKNSAWTTQNLLLILAAATTPRYGSITLDSVSNFGLLFYSAPSTYAGLNIEVSLNPMYDSLIGEINKVKDNTLMIMDNNNVHNYFTPIFKNFKAGTKIYTYLKSLPDNVPSGQIALTKTNAWTTDSILAGAISIGKTVEYTLASDCDVNLRFYNSNLSSFDGLELWISLSPIYNQVEKVSEYVGYVEYKETTVVVDVNGSGAFTSIREAVKSISDATIDNRYNVFVKNGTYNEIDIVTKSWVNITGESKDGVIVVTDGKSTALSPSDYHFGSYANTPINEIPVEYKHLLWHCSNSVVSNMTMIVNDCKYIVHQDEAAGAFVAVVKDCVLKRLEETASGAGNLVGCGLRHNEYVEYVGCDFITESPNMNFRSFSTAIYWHNMTGDNGSCGVKMKDCNVFNCHIMSFYDMCAPTQKNEIVIDNVQSDSSFYGIRILGTDGVAFKTKVIIKNCKPNFILLTEEISDYFKMALNPYTMSVCQVDESIVKGQPLSVNKYGSIVPVGVADSGEDFVLALEDLNYGELGYVNTGIAGLGLAEAGNYQSGDKLYISNGKFTKIASGNAVAFVLFNKQQDSDGLIIICKDV